MIIDATIQGTGFLNVIMGVNSLLESVGLVWVLYYYFSALKRREKSLQNREEGEKIVLDGVCSIVYFLRTGIFMVSAGVFLTGAMPFLVPAVALFAVSIFLAMIINRIHHCNMKSVENCPDTGIPSRYPRFSGRYMLTFWIPFLLGFTLLVLSLQGLEILGIAGWNRIQLKPAAWYIDVRSNDCNAQSFFEGKCKNRFFPVIEVQKSMRHLEYMRDCGQFKTWMRNRIDWLILVFGVL